LDIRNSITTNGIYQHVKANKKHEIDWENAAFVDKEANYLGRKIKESIYINALDLSGKPGTLMNLEKGISPCWNEFSSAIRGSIRKKI
jgi:hypothetical protein